MYTIYYAEITKPEIKELFFNSGKDIISFVMNMTAYSRELVWLVSIENEIFISDNHAMVQNLFDTHYNAAYPYFENSKIYIQEYQSFEDAYSVALNMRETSPLCYNK